MKPTTDEDAKDAAALAEAQRKTNAAKVKTNKKVTVACKIPNGLILRLHRQEDYAEQVLGGGTRMTKRAMPIGEPVFVAGPAVPFGAAPRTMVFQGYAMTPGIDADFWAEWTRQNADHDALRNHLLFAHESPDVLYGECKDHKAVLSGMQPMHPEKDLRIPRTPTSNLSPIATDPEGAKPLLTEAA